MDPLAEIRAAWGQLTKDEQDIMVQYCIELETIKDMTPGLRELLHKVNGIHARNKNISVFSVPEHVINWRKKL
jgi:hypothetical protein